MAEHRSTVRICCVAFLIWVAAAGSAGADPPTRESWPEIDTWLRLSSAWRLAVFVPLAENLDTHYREGNLILQADYGWAESKRTGDLVDEDRAQKMQIWLLRGGYLGGKSLDDHGAEYTEYTAFAELHLRLPLAHGILLSHRLRSDLRCARSRTMRITNWLVATAPKITIEVK